MKRLRMIGWCAALSLLASPVGSQDASRAKKIGLVLSFPATAGPYLAAVKDGLRDLGWVEGRDVVFEPRYYEGKSQRLAEVASELAGLPADVIVTGGLPPTRAIKQATRTIPIVVASVTDPVGNGIVEPAGNVAAFDVLPADSAAKHVAMLREFLPTVRRIAVVWNGSNPASQLNSRRVREAAQAHALELIPVEVPGPAALEGALGDLRQRGAEAIFLVADPQFFAQRKRIGELTTASGLPTLCQESDYAEAGCVVAYGANVVDMFRQSASYVDRILKGAKPADLPVGGPTRFELVVNLQTAKTIGVQIPEAIVARAHRRVE